jgi:oligopeptide/dipeptide ABC transporter ATP-binding protein
LSGLTKLLEVRDLTVHYSTKKGVVKALEGVSFDLEEGESLGLVGESGSGKTTAALSLLGLLPENARIIRGEILVDGQNIIPLSENELRRVRWKKISIVFQGAMNVLNPVFTVRDQIVETILLHEKLERSEAVKRTEELLTLVGIDPSRGADYPHQLSGGMKQRIVIANALASSPKIVVADEPTTALDVMVQGQILRLLKDLRKRLRLSLVLITHDLGVMAQTCDRCAVVYAGNIVEYGDVRSILKHPIHPYTEALLKAVPDIRAERRTLDDIPGDPPNLLEPPAGCKFHPRCAYAIEKCRTVVPALEAVTESRLVSCHLAQQRKEEDL